MPNANNLHLPNFSSMQKYDFFILKQGTRTLSQACEPQKEDRYQDLQCFYNVQIRS